MHNFGLIETQPNEKDYRLGGDTKLPKIVLQENRDWSAYLPIAEFQKDYTTGFDTYGCVTFSALNCLETLARKEGKEMNKSDRFTAKASDTIWGSGNFLNKVAESIRVDGTVDEKDYPMVGTVQEYYQPIPENIKLKGLEWAKFNKVGYEWVDWAGVDPTKLWEALQYGPIQVTVDYDAMVSNTVNKTTNHAVMVFRGKEGQSFDIYDHYQKTIHTVGWPFWFGSAMRYYIYPMIKLVKCVESPDVFLLGADGKKDRIEDDMNSVTKLLSKGLIDSSAVTVIPKEELNAVPTDSTILLYKSFRDV